jgi:hypothetical protein
LLLLLPLHLEEEALDEPREFVEQTEATPDRVPALAFVTVVIFDL